MKFKKIFFSYSRTDAAFALKLALDLKKNNFDVWIDQEDIRAGSEWDVEIENALTTCDCLLFIQSEKSVASTNVLDEVYYALEENKRVIPAFINNCKTPYRLNRIQRINFIDDYEKGLADLINNLLSDSFPEINIADEGQKKKFTSVLPAKYLIGILIIAAAFAMTVYFINKKPQQINQPVIKTLEAEDFTGNWMLTKMVPAATDKKGYLKIENAGEGKINIKTSVQFYYIKSNDTAYLKVFNAFAECTSCAVKNEMLLTEKQVDIGAQKYSISANGDTTLNAGTNNAIRAAVSLLLINKDSVLLKVLHPETSTIAYDMVVPPFEYSFIFKKEF